MTSACGRLIGAALVSVLLSSCYADRIARLETGMAATLRVAEKDSLAAARVAFAAAGDDVGKVAVELNKTRIKTTSRASLEADDVLVDELPVGTVVAWVYPPTNTGIPANWMLCNGDPVDDPASPFHGRKVPNLVKMSGGAPWMRYPAGSINLAEYGKEFGAAVDTSSGAGSHSHPGSTAAGDNGERADTHEGSGQHNRTNHMHAVTVGAAGTHSHESKIIPPSYGVLYIMKIKQ